MNRTLHATVQAAVRSEAAWLSVMAERGALGIARLRVG